MGGMMGGDDDWDYYYYGGDDMDMGFYPSYDKMAGAFNYTGQTLDDELYEMMLDLMNMDPDY